MNVSTLLLYVFEIITAGAALAILFTRNIFYAALWALITLLGVAAIFILMNAEFLGVTQLMIYAGGIVVILLFGIMITQRITGKPMLDKNKRMLPAITIGVAALYLFQQSIDQLNLHQSESTSTNTLQTIGRELMSNYILPFEIVGVVLLIALIAAAVAASGFKTDNNDTL